MERAWSSTKEMEESRLLHDLNNEWLVNVCCSRLFPFLPLRYVSSHTLCVHNDLETVELYVLRRGRLCRVELLSAVDHSTVMNSWCYRYQDILRKPTTSRWYNNNNWQLKLDFFPLKLISRDKQGILSTQQSVKFINLSARHCYSIHSLH